MTLQISMRVVLHLLYEQLPIHFCLKLSLIVCTRRPEVRIKIQEKHSCVCSVPWKGFTSGGNEAMVGFIFHMRSMYSAQRERRIEESMFLHLHLSASDCATFTRYSTIACRSWGTRNRRVYRTPNRSRSDGSYASSHRTLRWLCRTRGVPRPTLPHGQHPASQVFPSPDL